MPHCVIPKILPLIFARMIRRQLKAAPKNRFVYLKVCLNPTIHRLDKKENEKIPGAIWLACLQQNVQNKFFKMHLCFVNLLSTNEETIEPIE